MKPLISYYGGKQKIASKVVAELETIPHTVYCEPFFGGGAVFFARDVSRATNTTHYREAINDNSELLINLYRTIRKYPKEFNRLIQFTPYSQSEHKKAVDILKNHEQHDELEKAWAYYVSINQSFAHKLNHGWRHEVFSKNSASTWATKQSNILPVVNRLKYAYIGCEDALRFIRRWDSPQTLFYLDPPYPNTHLGHYGGYTLDDFQALCDLLDSIQGSYVLSNYPQPIEPKSCQRKIEIKTKMSASGAGKVKADRTRKATDEELGKVERTEVLWICDRSENIREELKDIALRNRKRRPAQQLSLFN